MKKVHNKRSYGFTLIELMIVMIIMGVLAALGVTAFISSQIKGRDSARKGDLNAIAQALELYYNDKGQYPKDDGTNSGTFTSCFNDIFGPAKCGVVANGILYNRFKDPGNTNTIYMGQYPSDPSPSQKYFYVSSTGSQYQLYAHLENDKPDNHDAQIITPTPPPSVTLDCGSGACNYGVSSANTSP